MRSVAKSSRFQLKAAHKRGFTMIELMVALTILAIIAAIAVPRMLGNDARTYRLTCEQVSDLLTMFGRRESQGGKPVGLVYDESRHELAMIQYDVDVDSGARDARWRGDLLVAPVKLPSFVELVEVRADGDYVDIAQWPLMNRPGHTRPTVSISLNGPDGVVTLVLPPHAVTPRQSGGVRETSPYPSPVDLNAMGRSRGEW